MNIALLGASGSIGRQTLDVIENNPKDFSLVTFSVGHNYQVIDDILSRHKNVKVVYLLSKEEIPNLKKKHPNIKFISTEEGFEPLINLKEVEMVVNALVGFAGLLPSVISLKCDKLLALANKESLVVGGEIINKLLSEGHGKLYPIDSEHSAIWKCLKVDDQNIDKIILTASGGPFRKLSREELVNVSKEDALNHPTWKMGNKITIDSATMMNKCFEIIEAYYLFGYPYEQVEVILHDESYLHSGIRYLDKSYRGEINPPDMRNPIKFALYEGNIPFDTVSFSSLDELSDLHFHKFDINRYPLVGLAKQVISKKGNLGAIINASNEEAVYAFLENKISFLDIEVIVNKALREIKYQKDCSLEDLIHYDELTRNYVRSLIGGNK